MPHTADDTDARAAESRIKPAIFYYLLPTTYYLLPPTSYLLPPTSCLLPPASCLLPPASCLPGWMDG
ncbi:hypothetical protein [Xylella fastidiosa]|uniref:hypothetical protein n=1 Tax=Xylella fastidiosa TaxID=2371 RepID=UPI001F3FA182|nr:hypothetical protein [Xylella fastidiosa]